MSYLNNLNIQSIVGMIGIYVLLSGLGIVNIKAVKIKQGKITWGIGAIFIIISIFLYFFRYPTTAENIKYYKDSEAQIKDKLLNLTDKYTTCTNKLNEYKEKKDIQKNINKLMHDFSSLGINLNHINWCDKQYTKRYNQAKSILSEIQTLALEVGGNNSYMQFVHKNSNTLMNVDLTNGKCVVEPILLKNYTYDIMK